MDYRSEVINIIEKNKIKLSIPSHVSRDTQLEYTCVDCDTKISKSVRAFCNNHLCPTCIINSKPPPYEKSLHMLEPEVSSLWHPTKNKKTPKDFRKSSMKSQWWLCPKKDTCGCLHEYEANICDMVKCKTSDSKGCPFCTKMHTNKKFCLHQSLCYLFPEISKYWSPKNEKTPSDFLPYSNEDVIWNCLGCTTCSKIHEYKQQISTKTRGKRNGEIRVISPSGGCIVCEVSTSTICDCQKLEIQYTELYKECDFEKNKKEDEHFDINIIPVCSNKNIWWKCSSNPLHSWNAQLNNRTTNKSGCPFCVNKTEDKLFTKLATIYPTIQKGFSVEWCKNKKNLPFDFVIPELKIILELDGPQHFYQISNWESPEKQYENDKYKEKCANEHNYSTIRIVQDDVWNDRNDWFQKLQYTINDIATTKKIQNVYICTNNEYSKF
jgi:very-short-patch-repair endonuclease